MPGPGLQRQHRWFRGFHRALFCCPPASPFTGKTIPLLFWDVNNQLAAQVPTGAAAQHPVIFYSLAPRAGSVRDAEERIYCQPHF